MTVDDSDDDAETKTENKPSQATVTPPKPAIPPVRTIPFKSAGNANKPPQNTIPTKKPLGKPLTMLKEKFGKQVCNACLHLSRGYTHQGIIDMNRNGNSANFFSYVCNDKKSKELFASFLNGIPISVICVSSIIFVFNA